MRLNGASSLLVVKTMSLSQRTRHPGVGGKGRGDPYTLRPATQQGFGFSSTSYSHDFFLRINIRDISQIYHHEEEKIKDKWGGVTVETEKTKTKKTKTRMPIGFLIRTLRKLKVREKKKLAFRTLQKLFFPIATERPFGGHKWAIRYCLGSIR